MQVYLGFVSEILVSVVSACLVCKILVSESFASAELGEQKFS